MKTLLKTKFAIALLTTGSICIISCQKDIKNLNNTPLQLVQKKSNGMADLKANAINYRASSEKSHQLLLANQKIAKQNIEKFTLDRKQLLNKPELISRQDLKRKSVIHVPEDYSTLQEAVDKSMDGGKIIIDGTVLQIGNVIVDVPNLTIQGEEEEKSATINDNSSAGDNLIVTVPGVTIKNLKLLNFGIVINNANSETLINLNASNSNPGILSVIALFGSNNNIVKNCRISYSILGSGGTSGIGILLDDFSNNNEVADCKVSNTQFTAFEIEGSNNRIKNCEAVNFYRGFISFDGVSTGNVYTGCVANHSYADAGFVFFNFSPNNTMVTLKSCTANDNVAFSSIIIVGSVKIDDCIASFNTRNIVGNIPGGIAVIGIGTPGEFADISNSTANSNALGGIGVVDINFSVTNNTCNKNLCLDPLSGVLAFFQNNGVPMSGTIKGNVANYNLNNAIGTYLSGITNSSVINNESLHNAVCDFNQTNCSGNTLTNNKFGTICTDL